MAGVERSENPGEDPSPRVNRGASGRLPGFSLIGWLRLAFDELLEDESEDLLAIGVEGETVVLQESDAIAGADRPEVGVDSGMIGEVEFGGVVNDEDALGASGHALPSVETVVFLQEVELGTRSMDDAVEAAQFVPVEALGVGSVGLIGHTGGDLKEAPIEASVAEADLAQFLCDPIAIARGLLGVHLPDLSGFSIIRGHLA